MAGGRSDDPTRSQRAKQSAAQRSGAQPASIGPGRQAGRRSRTRDGHRGPRSPAMGRAAPRKDRRRSRPNRIAQGIEARPGREDGPPQGVGRWLDAQRKSPAPRSRDAPRRSTLSRILELEVDVEALAGPQRARQEPTHVHSLHACCRLPSRVRIRSAGWVKIQSAPTPGANTHCAKPKGCSSTTFTTNAVAAAGSTC